MFKHGIRRLWTRIVEGRVTSLVTDVGLPRLSLYEGGVTGPEPTGRSSAGGSPKAETVLRGGGACLIDRQTGECHQQKWK